MMTTHAKPNFGLIKSFKWNKKVAFKLYMSNAEVIKKPELLEITD